MKVHKNYINTNIMIRKSLIGNPIIKLIALHNILNINLPHTIDIKDLFF